MQPNQSGWFAIRGSARQGKMRDKQGRDDPLVPVMPEVAVHRDGGLRRPAQEAARPTAAVASADATTALEAALSARVKRIYSTPRLLTSPQRARDNRARAFRPQESLRDFPRGPAPPLLRCSRQPRRLPPGRGISAWNGRAGPSPRLRAMGDACAGSERNS